MRQRTFDELVTEAESAPVTGWGFSWLDGRATEERPSWGYQRLLRNRLSSVTSALDVQTGGGEVLAGAGPFPPIMVATEPYPPNLALATRLLHPLGVAVIACDKRPLPFADSAFDVVTSRHPVDVWWDEVCRVLKPGGTYLGQHVGPGSLRELIDYLAGTAPETLRHGQLSPDTVRADVAEAGLAMADIRMERLTIEFYDVGAVIFFLRKLIWAVPGFTVDGYRGALLGMHEQIQEEGAFITSTSRILIAACKPD